MNECVKVESLFKKFNVDQVVKFEDEFGIKFGKPTVKRLKQFLDGTKIIKEKFNLSENTIINIEYDNSIFETEILDIDFKNTNDDFQIIKQDKVIISIPFRNIIYTQIYTTHSSGNDWCWGNNVIIIHTEKCKFTISLFTRKR